ncbi:MAG: M60 family metallopeptidase [Lentimonas sp.]
MNTIEQPSGMRYFLSLLCSFLFVSSLFSNPTQDVLMPAIVDLKQHLEGDESLPAQRLTELEQVFIKQAAGLKSDLKLIQEAFNVVNLYEETQKPLFLNSKTKSGFRRSQIKGIELERAIFALQQGILDHSFNSENLEASPAFFKDAKFLTSTYFPGAAEPASDPTTVLKTVINASQSVNLGSPQNGEENPARKPTGWYLPPGSVGVVAVPSSMINTGYSIRVGAHSWDLKKKPQVKRLDRVSLVYPITQQNTLIANPLGGGVYIEVPAKATGGLVTIHSKNLIESPFFSARFFDKTNNRDWKNRERSKQAPWADFESDKMMMQVPSAWIRELDDPEMVVADYDKSMDLISTLTGRSKVRPKVVLYHQVDVVLRGSAFYPGYPQSNVNWDPLADQAKYKNHWMVRGPQHAPHVLFHEMGHAERITKFRGETEALVNFLYVAVHNKGFGLDLDTAFSRSLNINNDAVSLDQAAISRMITSNFREGKPMNITNRPGDESKYQYRGYAKYCEVAALFGWPALEKFWAQDQENYKARADFPENVNHDPNDSRILRMSIAAGADLTPLIHFWGWHPDNASELQQAMKANQLKPSAKIYDKLNHYKKVIPMNHVEFKKHAKIMFPRVEQPGRGNNETNPLFGHGWYHDWLGKYNEEHGELAQKALQEIIDTYFPDGRPRW